MAKKKEPTLRVPLNKSAHEPISQKELSHYKIEDIIAYIQKYDTQEGVEWLKSVIADKKTVKVVDKHGKERTVTHPTYREIYQAFVNRYFEPLREKEAPKDIYNLINSL